LQASQGWLEKFLIRHNLDIRRPRKNLKEARARKQDAENMKIINFILSVQHQRQNTQYLHIYMAHKIILLVDAFGGVYMVGKVSRQLNYDLMFFFSRIQLTVRINST
jgi:hypothetical protein